MSGKTGILTSFFFVSVRRVITNSLELVFNAKTIIYIFIIFTEIQCIYYLNRTKLLKVF